MQPSAASDHEFHLSDREFDEIRRLVREHTGISLAESKRELVYSRLVRRLRRLSLPTFADYLAVLGSGEPAELEEFSNAITTNLTSFFREQHHFDFLAGTILPALEQRNAGTRRLRIWSAGCSTGEEPYSIAIVLQEALRRFRGWDVRILATDIDSRVVAHAQAGEYKIERFAKMPATRRERWFDAARPGTLAASAALKSLITFRQLNLMHRWPFKGPFDVIFCRNVVIYFDKETQRDLFARMAGLQRDGDYVCVGHSESLFAVCDQYQLIGKTTYRKIR